MENRRIRLKKTAEREVAGIQPGDLFSKTSTPVTQQRTRDAGLFRARAADALKPFGRGGHVFGLTKGQYSMIDVIATLLDRTGPARVSVWTWAIADYEVEAIGAFLADRRITEFRMVMDFSGARRHAELLGALQDRFGEDCLRVTKTHAKIATIATDDGWKVVARGSMNLNANPRFEQFDVTDCEMVYRVMREVEDEIWQRAPAVPVARVTHAQAVRTLDIGETELAIAPPGWAEGLSSKWF